MNTKKLSHILVAIFAALLLSACGNGTSAESVNVNLDDAQMLANNGEYQRAMELGNQIAESPDTALFTAQQYCRLAQVYATIADNITDNESAMAAAVSSLNHALAINADSVLAYINNLDMTQSAAIWTPLSLIRNANVDISKKTEEDDMDCDGHELDSVLLDTSHNHE